MTGVDLEWFLIDYWGGLSVVPLFSALRQDLPFNSH